MQDRIFIENLECFANHGVFREEQVLGQKFLVSADLYMSTRTAGKTDQLEQSVSYAEVCQHIQKFMKNHTFQLIETVAEQLAEDILLTFPLLTSIKLNVKKPWAPVCMSLDTVGVSIERGWHEVYLGIGSNLGDKEANLERAVSYFKNHRLCKEIRVSDWIATKPYGEVEQDDFLNGAIYMKTLLLPDEVLEEAAKVEKLCKRVREVHWGPRTIDVDVLFYDDWSYHNEKLCIPHREIAKRDFVLVPLCNLNPNLFHPLYQKTVLELYEELTNGAEYESNLLSYDENGQR